MTPVIFTFQESPIGILLVTPYGANDVWLGNTSSDKVVDVIIKRGDKFEGTSVIFMANGSIVSEEPNDRYPIPQGLVDGNPITITAMVDGVETEAATLYFQQDQSFGGGGSGGSGPPGPPGTSGRNAWTPLFAIVADGDREVIQIVDWVGGSTQKPDSGMYLGPSGMTSTIAEAVDIKGAAGDDGTDGTNGTNGTNGADGAKGADGVPGKPIELDIQSGGIYWRVVGADTWTFLIALSALKGESGSPGSAGTNGREVEFSVDPDDILWRYVGDATWTTLIPRLALKGDTGPVGIGVPDGGTSGQILAKVSGDDYDTEWINPQSGGGGTPGAPGEAATFEIAGTVTGAAGTNAAVEETHDSTPTHRKYTVTIPRGEGGAPGAAGTDGTNGTNGRGIVDVQFVEKIGLVTTYEIIFDTGAPVEFYVTDGAVGATGTPGTPGAPGTTGGVGPDGPAIELDASTTDIRWRVVGTSTWTVLLAKSELKGPKGDDGEPPEDCVTSQDVATIVMITQAAYDLLTPKDPTTLYLITEV